MAEFPAATTDVFLERIAAFTSPFSQIQAWVMGGAVTRVPPGATAVGERENGFHINFVTGWPPADPDGERHTAWVREVWNALRAHSVERLRANIPPSHWGTR